MQDDKANVVSLLKAAAERNADRQAIVMGDGADSTQRITFGDLWSRVDRVGAGLSKLGIEQGDRAVIMIPMSIDLYTLLLAVLKIGAAAVFVDPWISRQQIARFAAFSEPKAYFGIGKAHLLRWMDSQLRQIPLTVTTGNRWGGWAARHSLEELLSTAGDGRIAGVEGDDSALITFTTGSSGEPKGANRTHGYLLAQHAALQHEFPYHDSDIDLTMFPVFALNNLAKGIPTIVPEIDFRKVAEADGGALVNQIAREQVATITGSPPLIDRMCKALVGSSPPSSLRRILVGGAPVSDAQLTFWQQRLPNVEIVVVYGSTEAEPVAHIPAAERLEIASNPVASHDGYCVGKPTDLLQSKVIRIVDSPVQLNENDWSDWQVPAGEVGELVVTGEHVGRDYFRNPQAVAANKIVDRHGTIWHRMGDTGYFDHLGRFWLVGRVHSTIRRDGVLVHPQVVEQIAAGDPVEQVAALGIEDAVHDERLVVVASISRATDAAARTIADRLAKRGVEWDEIALTEGRLPVDPRHNSKIDYARLRTELESSRASRDFVRWKPKDLRNT
ncbi:AMP-binding protein [Aeoliella mucimassa]|uniref:Long-chain-fatty-acid--CoA ligase n=1 Tax=Aeoliella mucimassa TaxID=2527972 RepID=A0A518AK43_9BACT|nr:AMP-binding protein [Aeoliella mucimassa]QDU55098.1 Long-chain-fatty-acid--CoA ligase [Aeoliella mucimassa]